MSRSELDNFVYKFHQLRSRGFTAHLDLDTHARKAWVGLRVMLGNVQQQHQVNSKSRNRSPSYFRRQERRKAARAAAESQNLPNNVSAEEATNSSNNISSKCLIETVPNASNDKKPTEKVSFECDQCDFVSNRQAGLKIHTTRKHATIEQLDGNIEYFNIDKGWREDLERNDEFIESYLMTGEISPEINGYEINEFKELVQFVLSPHSHQSRTLISVQLGSEVLLLLESRIDAKDGPGSFIHYSPWRDMVD